MEIMVKGGKATGQPTGIDNLVTSGQITGFQRACRTLIPLEDVGPRCLPWAVVPMLMIYCTVSEVTSN